MTTGERDRKQAYFARAVRQLALEYDTRPEAFTVPRLTVTSPAKPEGARLYTHEAPFFSMAMTGNSVVVMADERLHAYVRMLAGEVNGLHRLFEFPALRKLDAKLREYGYALWGTEHMFLPGRSFPETSMPPGFAYKWFEGEDAIRAFYPNERFRMALSADYNPDRPDALALAAMDGERIVALSGASANTRDMWQVGIDVLPAYRGHGLGTALVHALSRRIEEKGCLPFYGTAVANLHSQNIAVCCGFYPAWVEADAYKL